MKINRSHIQKIVDAFGFEEDGKDRYFLRIGETLILIYHYKDKVPLWRIEISNGHTWLVDVINSPLDVLNRYAELRIAIELATQRETIQTKVNEAING